jgi:L-lactate dehydrogenase complex protein LldF
MNAPRTGWASRTGFASRTGHASRTGFASRASAALADPQLRRNLAAATGTIRARRAQAVAELPDWEELREAGRQIRERSLLRLEQNLVDLERAVRAAGGQVHWAPRAQDARRIVGELVAATGARQVVKVKSMATEEIGLNASLAARGIDVVESDLAELIVQLAGDRPSHILVPAIHRNRAEIAALFRARLPGAEAVGEDPTELAEAARRYLRERFLTARVAISGANFAVAETGTVCVVESEGNGRMCTTLPETLITVMGIEKVLERFEDLAVMLRLLPRSSTAERMNPYTSLWTGVRADDGPRRFHLVLLDAGRTGALADPVGRQALWCIRCSACLNVCPVYERVGGHAYGSVYPGPIGAILAPQLEGADGPHADLPWASSLCGACYEVCPVKIDIPTVLIHLRSRAVRSSAGGPLERAGMSALARVFRSPRLYGLAQRLAATAARPLARGGRIDARLPGLSGWTRFRDLPAPASESFSRRWARLGRPGDRG